MATFTNEAFRQHDGYFTPKSALESIKEYIPRNKLIWECFYGNGDSARFLTELGFNVVSPAKRINFGKWENNQLAPTNSVNFDCYFYCYKIGLPRDIIHL